MTLAECIQTARMWADAFEFAAFLVFVGVVGYWLDRRG